MSTGTIKLADYRPPLFTTNSVELYFRIYEDHTLVTSKVTYEKTATESGAGQSSLVLHAQDPNSKPGKYIRRVRIDGRELSESEWQFDSDKDTLTLTGISEGPVTVEIETYIEPQFNTALSGFYKSDHCFVTQCESEGFRRITPFLDRPDVMATYTVTIDAPADLCPVLISNGNLIDSGKLPDGRHFAKFNDPWPKPSYLFATANGKLDSIHDTFTTSGGRKVDLYVYTDTERAQEGWHAMDALKRSMKWDEETFNCEYDLDNYHVVAVSKFSMGAMENKGLNVFRDSLVLASPKTATDTDYQNIIDVIGHEYFHNYSGNRVTCANWFHLSLKEGLTVNREQLFTAYTTSDALERISAVQVLRGGQFPEDDSPNCHPVLPAEIGAIDNIYSATVYLKGSEVIRMMKTIIGEEKFIEGVKHYFKTYDGQAVTISEFVKSMEHVSGFDFSGQFHLWYSQSGRPRLTAEGSYNEKEQTYTLKLTQKNHPTRDQTGKKPMMIPVLTALVSDDGENIEFEYEDQTGGEHVILLTQPEQSFTLTGVSKKPAFHSLLRNFSAPVDIDPGLSTEQLRKQLANDTDGFNRWDAGQKLTLLELTRLYGDCLQTKSLPEVDPGYIDTIREVLDNDSLDANLKAVALSMPSVSEFEAQVKPADPAFISKVKDHLIESIAVQLKSSWQANYEKARAKLSHEYRFTYEDSGFRRMAATCLYYLCVPGSAAATGEIRMARDLYFSADNMTDKIAAMNALKDHDCKERSEVFDNYLKEFQNDTLTIQKYFALRAGSDFTGITEELSKLTQSSYFNWHIPGHVQNLYRGFIRNYTQFHSQDGNGYRFLADGVIKETSVNGTTAAGMITALCRFREYTETYQKQMIEQLKRIDQALKEGLQAGKLKKEDTGPVFDRILKSLPEN